DSYSQQVEFRSSILGAGFLTAHVLAVYASHPPGLPVEWQDSLPGCPLRLCPGWTFTNKLLLKGFIYSCSNSPLPSFAWRACYDFATKRASRRRRLFSFMHHSQGGNLVWIQLFAVYGTPFKMP